MINNKKAMSTLIIGLISVVIAFMIFVFAFPNAVGDLSSQIKEKMTISKFLPNNPLAEKEPITKQAADYSFEIVERILDDSYIQNQPANPLLKGSFLFVRREVLDDNYLLGFVDLGEGYKLYLSPDADKLYSSIDLESLKSNSATYFDTALFDNDIDRDAMRSLLENKIFVVMSREDGRHNEVALFLHYITGLSLEDSDAEDLKQTYSFEDLLKRHTVKSLAFSTGKTSDLYWNEFDDDQTNEVISERKDDYILIYRYFDEVEKLDYVVFFPLDSRGTQFDEDAGFEIYGYGHVDKDIFEDLENQNMIIKVE